MSLIEDLERRGWTRWPTFAEDPFFEELVTLRSWLTSEFTRMVNDAHMNASTATGQYGFTADGDEGEGDVREIRSHLVWNQTLPDGHPLSESMPLFYGAHHLSGIMSGFAQKCERLAELLDLFTLEYFEKLEAELGLEFGKIAGNIAMGERLLRFQWYPPISDGEVEEFMLPVHGKVIPVAGIRKDNGQVQVRVSPHRDTGHWTWQVGATDAQLRFWDDHTEQPASPPVGNFILGNVGDFLELELPGFRSPVHWVDMDENSRNTPRVSISYFVHARPSVSTLGRPAGARLYDRLLELGYAAHDERQSAIELLDRGDWTDAELVRRTLHWEEDNGFTAPGFASGLSRYFEQADMGSLPSRRRRESVPPLRDFFSGETRST